jgi:DeoR/GlpR family transcriptional regulator of sugar metabolism
MSARPDATYHLRRSRELPQQRHRWITTTLRRSGAVSVREIVDRFGVSEATARRDIDTVGRREGRRVYGGLLCTRVPPGADPVRTSAARVQPEE